MFLSFFSSRLVSRFSPLWTEKMLDISIFLNLLRLVLCPMCSTFENVPYAFEKNMYFASLRWKVVYIFKLSPFDLGHCSMLQDFVDVLFRSVQFLQWGGKIPYYNNVAVYIFLKAPKIFLIYFGAPMLGAYIFTMFLSSWWLLPLSIMKCPSVSLCGLCFEVCFVRYKYCYLSFFFLTTAS